VLSVALLLLMLHEDRCDWPGDHLGGIWPHKPLAEEWMWTLFLRAGGFRLFGSVLGAAPAYRSTLWFAAPVGQGAKPQVALTIDDAVGRRGYMNATEYDNFEALLDILDELEVKALFFVIANDVIMSESGGSLLRRAYAAGHEIGNHGVVDSVASSFTRAQFQASIETWERRVRSVVGAWPARATDWKWYRPPKGAMSTDMKEVLEEEGYKISLPDVWSGDSTLTDAGFHARVLTNAACDGSVVLMHAPDASWGTQILDVFRQSVPVLRGRGFEIVGISDMFARSGVPSSARAAWSFVILVTFLASLTCIFSSAVFCGGKVARRQLRRATVSRKLGGSKVEATDASARYVHDDGCIELGTSPSRERGRNGTGAVRGALCADHAKASFPRQFDSVAPSQPALTTIGAQRKPTLLSL